MIFLRRRLPRLGPLLALLLLVGQVLAQAHATRHELASGASHVSCAICVVAHGGSGPPAQIVSTVFAPRETRYLVADPLSHAPRQTLARPRSRAPPALT